MTDMKIQTEDRFDSLYDFYSSAISEAEKRGAKAHDRYFGDKRTSFYMEREGKRSVSFALAGWKKGLDYVNENSELIRNISGDSKPTYQRGYSGSFIDMGAYVSGRPDCWIEETEERDVHQSGRIKRIAVGSSFMGEVTPEQYRRRGAIILGMIDILETAGYRVELDIIATSYGMRRKSHATVIRAKNAEDALNREKLAYALMSADFFRRFVFAIRGLRHRSTFGSDGGGATINLKHADKMNGSSYGSDYDLVFPNADHSYWKGYDTPEESKETIEKELKKIGVDVG